MCVCVSVVNEKNIEEFTGGFLKASLKQKKTKDDDYDDDGREEEEEENAWYFNETYSNLKTP